jgi:hypothetical protein
MLKKLDWLSINQQIKIKALKFVHSVVTNDKNNMCLQTYMYKINAEVHNINRRQSQNFHMFHQNNIVLRKKLLSGQKIKKSVRNQVKIIKTIR